MLTGHNDQLLFSTPVEWVWMKLTEVD